jgi:hypothetical protein
MSRDPEDFISDAARRAHVVLGEVVRYQDALDVPSHVLSADVLSEGRAAARRMRDALKELLAMLHHPGASGSGERAKSLEGPKEE